MTLALGDSAPDFDLPSTDGTTSLASLKGDWLVLYFYPADETPGCTLEACAFRDSYEDFTEAGANVVGVSGDSVEKHHKFKANRKLPFTLISDADGTLRKAFGVKKSIGVLDGRVTFVIDPEGVVRDVFSSQLRFKQHQARALSTIRAGAQ